MQRHLAFLLVIGSSELFAQGTGQTSYRLVLTQDAAAPDVHGAGVAVVHGLWNRGDLAFSAGAGAVKVAGEWSQGAGLDFLYVPVSLSPAFARWTPYVAFEVNQTRLGGDLETGYVAFVGLSINNLKRERTNWRSVKVTPSWIHEARHGWLAGGRYFEYNLGYAP
jgi:hypothetical protein